MIATKDNAIYLEKIVEQSSEKNDWGMISDTTLLFIPPQIPLLPTTSATTIETITPIAEGDNILLINGENGVHPITLGAVTQSNIDITDTPDPFGDNSSVLFYPFNGDVEEKIGGVQGEWVGNESYDTGKWGDSVKLDGSSLVKLNQKERVEQLQKFLSLWVLLDEAPDETKVVINVQQDDSGWTNFDLAITDESKIKVGGRSDDHDNASYTSIWESDTTLNTGEWYHIALMEDTPGEYSIYLNGEKIGSFDFNFYIPPNSYRQTAGGFINSSDDSDLRYLLKGRIDQMRVFNRPLSPEEVITLYNEELRKYAGDITSAGFSTPPVKAFKNKVPSVEIALEATPDDIGDESFTTLEVGSLSFDGTKFQAVYSSLKGQGRAFQRKMLSPEGVEIIEPFTSKLWVLT